MPLIAILYKLLEKVYRFDRFFFDDGYPADEIGVLRKCLCNIVQEMVIDFINNPHVSW